MCGIVGYLALNQAVAYRYPLLVDKLVHRGPDDCGIFESPDGRVRLGHRRLSIIDLSHLGHQPMESSDGRFVIVFNGEIFNYKQIKAKLTAIGVEFVGNSDTEVLLAAFKVWGEDVLPQLNGMFAFAIYDKGTSDQKPSLFFARDRAGEKPFYYLQTNDRFEFASELKALNHSGNVGLEALNYYLAMGYVPGDMCLIEGVKKLPPAYCGRLNLMTSELVLRPYWTLPASQKSNKVEGSFLVSAAAELIEDSVKIRLEADVPVGVLLSGGLDSSIVAAAAARVSSGTINTFTIALPGSALDESHHAKKVSDYLGTQHHVLELDRPNIELLDGLAAWIDEPIADSSILPAWQVFKLAKQKVTVALGGDGGDELFGGYPIYAKSVLNQLRYGFCPAPVLASLAKIVSYLPAGVRGRNYLGALRGGALQQIIWGGPYFDATLRSRILKKESWVSLGDCKLGPENFLLALFSSGTSPVDRMTRTHFGSTLPDDFLFKVDRASMACSLEVRTPMLDYRLIEFCFSQVPDEWKVSGNETRKLQRLIAKNWLPPDLDTQRKQGFSIPINEWLKAEGEAKLLARMEFLPDYINFAEVRSLVRGHLSGRANGGRLFALIMLALAMKNLRS